ncbi:MAG: MmcQ/YjbR family DNA-binding protein [Selenomonadaceae bacterium]|nr:MmcQ/YjbR family DNA-binding protein [Selenomonadaceae bacterium]
MQELKLKNKAVAFDRLKLFGFGGGRYEKNICGGQFKLTLTVAQDGRIFSAVTDNFSGEEYILHLVENSVGSYVGAVRAEYDAVVSNFIETCCESNIFRGEMTQRLIEYVRETYSGELEFLWENLPSTAIWRRQDTRKWYGVLMNIPERKLKLDSDKIVYVVNLRGDALTLADGVKIFPGWHMNKKSWITIKLDGSAELDEICRRLDESYARAVK